LRSTARTIPIEPPTRTFRAPSWRGPAKVGQNPLGQDDRLVITTDLAGRIRGKGARERTVSVGGRFVRCSSVSCADRPYFRGAVADPAG
jgi:hypothetical protein